MSDPASPTPHKNRNHYLLGLGLGLIPLIVILIVLGLAFQQSVANLAVALLYVSLVLYLISIIAMIVCLTNRTVRFAGYGLLTAVLASPVIAFISCVVLITVHA